ncbi:MAG: NAD(+) synthase, partial [Haloferacaceae archaeon]
MSTQTVLTETAPLDLRLDDDELNAVRDRIVGFVREMVDAAGADGALVGLSGGIDSTTTAYLAVEALGAENVRGLVMPSEVNDEGNMSDAERVAEDLGVDYDVVDIAPVVESFVDAFPGEDPDAHPEEEPYRTAVGNVRVRTRAVLNYFVANVDDRVVLGTGNRSEALTGY